MAKEILLTTRPFLDCVDLFLADRTISDQGYMVAAFDGVAVDDNYKVKNKNDKQFIRVEGSAVPAISLFERIGHEFESEAKGRKYFS